MLIRQDGSNQSVGNPSPIGFRQEDLERKAGRNGPHKRNDNRLDLAKTKAHQTKQNKDIQSGQENTPEQGDFKEQIQGNGGTNDLRQVAGNNRDLTEQPER